MSSGHVALEDWLRRERLSGTDVLAAIAKIEASDEQTPDATTIAKALGKTRQKLVPVLAGFVRAGCLREVQPGQRSKPLRYRLTPLGQRSMEAALSCRKPFRPLNSVIDDPILSMLLASTL